MQTDLNNYRQANYDYWQSEYETKYPDTMLVKLYHHVIKHQIKSPSGLKMLDYGCSNGANAFFFQDLGFKVHGVDINKIAIEKAKKANHGRHFEHITMDISEADWFFEGDFDLIVSWHTLCYLSNSDLNMRLVSLYNNLKPGGYFVTTLAGIQTASLNIGKGVGDGLYKIPIIERLKGLHGKEHFISYIKDQSELKAKLNMFTVCHTGYVDECFSLNHEAKDNFFYYMFVGRKE